MRTQFIDHYRRDKNNVLEESPQDGPFKFVLLKDFLPTNSGTNTPFYALACVKYHYKQKPSDLFKSSPQYYYPYDSNGNIRYISYQECLKEYEIEDKIFMTQPTIPEVWIDFLIGTVPNFEYAERWHSISESSFLSMIQEGYCKVLSGMDDFYTEQRWVLKNLKGTQFENEELWMILGSISYEKHMLVFKSPLTMEWSFIISFENFFDNLYNQGSRPFEFSLGFFDPNFQSKEYYS